MCAAQFSLLSIITPRNLVLFFKSTMSLLIIILKFVLCFIRVRCSTLVESLFTLIIQSNSSNCEIPLVVRNEMSFF